MERNKSDEEEEEGGGGRGMFSCWGRLRLKIPWKKRIRIRNKAASLLRRTQKQGPRAAGGFKYDPLSYAQNFDDGSWDDDVEDGFNHGFSSRFAPPSSRISLQDKQ